MTRRWIWLCMALGVMACWVVSLGRTLAQSHMGEKPVKSSSKESKQPKAAEKTAVLGGAQRFLTAVSTDKPIYHPGEKVYIRGVVLDAASHKPLPNGQSANATIEIKGSRGDLLTRAWAPTQDSVWGCAWEVPEGQAGGEYTIFITYPNEGHAPAQRKFDIRNYRAPRLKSQITFLRDGYGPGDKVTATLDVKRAEGGVPQGAQVTVNARIDGVEVDGGKGVVDERGFCTVSFDLPKHIERGEGTLALAIADGGVVETASKTIPILLQTVDLQAYPEGGDLVAGFKNRVYFQANQPNGKPADISGKLVSKVGGEADVVTTFKTEHEGRGRFEFTPQAGRSYYLTVSAPAGIKTTFQLPDVKTTGAVIHSDADVYKKNQPVTVQIGCTDKNYRVTLNKREVQVASDEVVGKGSHEGSTGMRSTSFDAPSDVDGVLTVTVWGASGKPLAERVIFREPAKPINISITPDKKTYIPGDSAKLKVKATTPDGKPVSALVGLTVTDDTVLEMVEEREKAPRLPVMVFLEPEVFDLADAAVYLDPANPKSSIATDLLLGTQGWRRFALMNPTEFVAAQGDKGRRILAMKVAPEPMIQEEAADMAFGGAVRERAFAMPGHAPVPAPMAARPPVGLEVERKVAMDDEKKNVANDKNVPRQAAGAKAEAAWGAPVSAVAGRMMRMDFRAKRANIFQQQVVVREFAHSVRPDRKPNDRVDFAETLFWSAGVKTDATTGEATINFGLNDSVTTFKVFADAFSEDGALASTTAALQSVQPFYVEAKMPLEVTEGDRVLLPISLVNATEGSLANVNVDVALGGDEKLGALEKGKSTLSAGERVRWIQPIDLAHVSALKELTLNAATGAFTDKLSRKLSVKAKGFPIETAFGGVLEPGQTVSHTVVVPEALVPGSVTANTSVFPTPLANLTEALQRLIQDPYGCFEQTSSTSYPLTMAQQYFLSHTNVDPKLVETSRQKLDDGYKKLVAFWCPDRGYEWFGENPGHEALTAFGLLHFTDMQKVRDVDQNMITATRAWLVKQKDGQGGFTRKRRALHTWIEDKDCSNAYILWALLECGQSPQDLTAELSAIKSAAQKSDNMYVVALAANALYLSGDKAAYKTLADKLASKQKADGGVDGIKSSIVGSSGESLEVEGTSLATLAWLRDPAYVANVEKSIKFLADSCKAGRYGSTQATTLALRAIVTYDKQRARPKAAGKLRLCVDGKQLGDLTSFDQNTQGAIKLPDMTALLTPGEHKIELSMQGGSAMPYSIAANYNALTPASSRDCKLSISTNLAQAKVVEGASTEANVTVVNLTKEVVPTPIAIVGLPGGLEPRHAQLKELVKKGVVDAYEVRGREVVLYWRTLAADARVDIPLSLIAAVPGTYTGPASRAYLYYGDEVKQWVPGMAVEISCAKTNN